MRRGDRRQDTALPGNVYGLTDDQDLTDIKPGHDVAHDFTRAHAKRQSKGQSPGPETGTSV